MNRKYSDNKIRKIAEKMLDSLMCKEDGFETTLSNMAEDMGYFDMEMFDLMELNNELFDLARQNNIVLDMSAHEGVEEGMPYYLTFTLRK